MALSQVSIGITIRILGAQIPVKKVERVKLSCVGPGTKDHLEQSNAVSQSYKISEIFAKSLANKVRFEQERLENNSRNIKFIKNIKNILILFIQFLYFIF